MGDVDRRVLDPSDGGTTFDYAIVNVHGNTIIEKGDLIFMDRIDGLRRADSGSAQGSSTADDYGYPFNKLSCSTNSLAWNKRLAKQHFIGVAMTFSDAGVTEKIGVWTKGIFKYPLKHARALRTGYDIVPCGTGVTLYNQRVAVESGNSTYRIGKSTESGNFKASVRMRIISRVIECDYPL